MNCIGFELASFPQWAKIVWVVTVYWIHLLLATSEFCEWIDILDWFLGIATRSIDLKVSLFNYQCANCAHGISVMSKFSMMLWNCLERHRFMCSCSLLSNHVHTLSFNGSTFHSNESDNVEMRSKFRKAVFPQNYYFQCWFHHFFFYGFCFDISNKRLLCSFIYCFKSPKDFLWYILER